MDGNILILFTLSQMMWVSNMCRVFRHSNQGIYSSCDQNLNITIDLSLWKLRCRNGFSKIICSKYHTKQLSLHLVWKFLSFLFLVRRWKNDIRPFCLMNLLIGFFFFDNALWPRDRKRRKRYMKNYTWASAQHLCSILADLMACSGKVIEEYFLIFKVLIGHKALNGITFLCTAAIFCF